MRTGAEGAVALIIIIIIINEKINVAFSRRTARTSLLPIVNLPLNNF